MGIYRRDRSPYWWAAYRAPVTEAGRLKRRADGVVVTRQVLKSTKIPHRNGRAGKKKAEALLSRWEGEAQRLINLSVEEEEDRLRARQAAEEHEEKERQEEARRKFTLDDLRDLWLRHASQKKSLNADRTRFATVLELLGPDRPIAEITTADLIGLRDELRQRPNRRKKPNSPATVNRHLALVRSAFKAAQQHGHWHQDPMRGVKLLPEKNKRDRICSREEYERIIAAADPKLRIAVVVGYHTGMRLGDVAALTWDAIDLEQKIIRVRSQDEKTGHGRTLPIVDEVVKELQKVEPKTGRLFPYRPRKEGVNHGAGPTLSKAFLELVERLQIPDLHFHDLRHTASTNLRRAGADLFTLQALTGHKDLATLRRYQTITDADLRTAVERSAKMQKKRKRKT